MKKSNKILLSIFVANSILLADSTKIDNAQKTNSSPYFEIVPTFNYVRTDDELKMKEHLSYGLRFSLLNNSSTLSFIRSVNLEALMTEKIDFEDVPIGDTENSNILRYFLNFHISSKSIKNEKFRPYLILGGGLENLVSPSQNLEDSKFFDWGVGVSIYLQDKVNLKFEFKDLIRSSSTPESGLHEQMIGFGIGIGFGNYIQNKKALQIDSDSDGILDSHDKCPNTTKGVQVDMSGCESKKDSDYDGILDSEDKCPHTLIGIEVDEVGCPVKMDSDSDGVIDTEDKCDNTRYGLEVDEFGCPKDSDGDNVYDTNDVCPNTPRGLLVNEEGCPNDIDQDGILDERDKCPDTKLNLRVDSNGCPLPDDTDNDGILDINDKCPSTFEGKQVDSNGCAILADIDQDGIIDSDDRCPNTPNGIKINSLGCALDSDYDGVPDFFDECSNSDPKYKILDNGCYEDDDGDGTPNEIDDCPITPSNYKVTADGCPLSVDLNIKFESLKSKVSPKYTKVIEEFAQFMKDNKIYTAEIQGYTDSSGSQTFNKRISEERAKAVYDYIIDLGVESSRLSYHGYGEYNFIATNETYEGREQNRRVEAKLSKNIK